MIRHSEFKFPYQYFHLNFEMNILPQFKSLDWGFLCHNLNKCLFQWRTLEIQALVMMDTHVHILFKISDSMENFFTNDFIKLMGQKIPSEILVEPIKNYSQYLNTYKYIYRNPYEAGLCHQCENYPYSSLSLILGKNTNSLKIVDKMNLIQNPQKILTWLNTISSFKNARLSYSRHDNSFLM